MPRKLTTATRSDIQLQLEDGVRVAFIADAYRITETQVYKM